MLYEADDLHAEREWVGAAVVSNHHGSAGHRTENVFGGVTLVFTDGSVDLARGHHAQIAGSWSTILQDMVHEHTATQTEGAGVH
ncbi:hypothetical protein ABZY31_24110 [Streptomyces sp. NPDC006529]|uniref:hypothetical protein n=1 Tax=Streptomyces sp. NPDC006529 TaxID=3157177 RepID=UPI0033B9D817